MIPVRILNTSGMSYSPELLVPGSWILSSLVSVSEQWKISSEIVLRFLMDGH